PRTREHRQPRHQPDEEERTPAGGLARDDRRRRGSASGGHNLGDRGRHPHLGLAARAADRGSGLASLKGHLAFRTDETDHENPPGSGGAEAGAGTHAAPVARAKALFGGGGRPLASPSLTRAATAPRDSAKQAFFPPDRR